MKAPHLCALLILAPFLFYTSLFFLPTILNFQFLDSSFRSFLCLPIPGMNHLILGHLMCLFRLNFNSNAHLGILNPSVFCTWPNQQFKKKFWILTPSLRTNKNMTSLFCVHSALRSKLTFQRKWSRWTAAYSQPPVAYQWIDRITDTASDVKELIIVPISSKHNSPVKCLGHRTRSIWYADLMWIGCVPLNKLQPSDRFPHRLLHFSFN
jgi:hypothetical protein